LEKENLKQNDLTRDLLAKIAAQDGLQKELVELKEKVTRHESVETELRMKARERTMDIRQKTKAGQRLSQRKRKRKIRGVRIHNEPVSCKDGLGKSNRIEKVVHYGPPLLQPKPKPIAEVLPITIGRHARQTSRAPREFSTEGLNTFVISPPPHFLDSRLGRMAFV